MAGAAGGWSCEACGRLFARARQSHDCSPGLSLEEYFSTGPSFERPVFDAVLAVLAEVGPVHVDCVSVGLFLKNPEKFAELRPMRSWVAVWFALPRRATHPTITRKVNEYAGRFWHVANVRSVADVDTSLAELLTESYLSHSPGTDPLR